VKSCFSQQSIKIEKTGGMRKRRNKEKGKRMRWIGGDE